MKKILITGASGYIGRNLVEQFEAKYHLFTPTHRTLDLLNGDAVYDYFKKNRFDVVIHGAVIGGSRLSEQVEGAFSKNLEMFFNIVRGKKYFKKMIHFGSGAEYDKSIPLISVKESDFSRRIPTDEYGFYKYICSRYIDEVDNIINLRIFGIFGKYEDYELRFISNAICKNIFHLPITMNQNVFFDYVYINDFVRIVDYFIQHGVHYKVYNIGTGEKIDIVTIAKKINQISGYKSEIIVKKRGLNKEYIGDNHRLVNEIKSFQFTNFDTALKELYQWYQARKKLLNKKSFLSDKR